MCVSLFIEWCRIKIGRTLVFVAAEGGHLKVVEYLVTVAKVNPNQSDKVLSVICDGCDGGVCVCLG